MTKKERQLVFEKYDGKCAYCGCVLTKGWHVDHLKPIRRKKYDKTECRYPQRECVENYMPACASCNINKHAMKLEDFRQLVAGFMKHLNERNTQYKIAKRYGLVVEQEKPIVFYFEQCKLTESSQRLSNNREQNVLSDVAVSSATHLFE